MKLHTFNLNADDLTWIMTHVDVEIASRSHLIRVLIHAFLEFYKPPLIRGCEIITCNMEAEDKVGFIKAAEEMGISASELLRQIMREYRSEKDPDAYFYKESKTCRRQQILTKAIQNEKEAHEIGYQSSATADAALRRREKTEALKKAVGWNEQKQAQINAIIAKASQRIENHQDPVHKD